MTYMTLLFGRIEKLQINKRTFDTLISALKKYGVKGNKPKRRGFLNPKKNEYYITCLFYKEITETSENLDESNQRRVLDQYNSGDFKRLFFFDNGYVVIESSQKTGFDEITNKIKIAWKSIDNRELFIKRIYSFPYELLKDFYKKSEEVYRLRVRDIGTTPPNPSVPPRIIKKLVEETGEKAETLDLSTGRKKKNLKEAELVDKGIVKISKPTRIRGKTKDNVVAEININGRVTLYAPIDEEIKEARIASICKKIIDFFISFKKEE